MPKQPSIHTERVPATCKLCSKVFMKVKKRKCALRCPDCEKVFQSLKPSKPLGRLPNPGKRHIETVLPKGSRSHFDKVRGDWYMPVRTRKRRSGDKFDKDRIYLHVGADATPEQVSAAFTAAYARLELQGCSTKPETGKEAAKRKLLRNDKKCWMHGDDRNLGISKLRVSRVMFAVHLYDPKIEGKKICVGRYPTVMEARKARKKKYEEIQWQLVPCKLCGELPIISNFRIAHIHPNCPNRVQFPTGVRPLYQTKLWNCQFSSGKRTYAGRLSREDLHQMGFLSLNKLTGEYRAIPKVEHDTRLCSQHAPKPQKDEVFFE